jgi:hypothetical protein
MIGWIVPPDPDGEGVGVGLALADVVLGAALGSDCVVVVTAG